MADGLTMAGAASGEPEPAAPARLLRYLPLILILAALVLGYAMGWHRYLSLGFLAESRDALNAAVESRPVLSALAFAALYVVAVACAFPAASVLTVFGGFLFGWLAASVLVAFAATLGATILFLAARSAFGGFLRDRVGAAAQRLAQGFEDNAFGYLLALRLAPFIPFFVVNIAPALLNVRLKTFVGATFLGILPGVVAYAWLGQGVDSVLTAARRSGRDASLADLATPEITLAFAALALVAAISAIVKHRRSKPAG
jgi:uncharacterized membrane protein YdjX (TVP38/TMEM64 family)